MAGVRLRDVPKVDHFALAEELCRETWAPKLKEFQKKLGAPPRPKVENELQNRALAKELGTKAAELKERTSKVKAELHEELRSKEEHERRLDDLKVQKDDLVEKKRLFVEEIKYRYDAYLSARSVYKNHLRIRIDLEDDGIVVRFFSAAKTKSRQNSIVLSKSEDGKYTLLKTEPHLEIFDQLAERLKSTNELPGLVWCVRKCFLHRLISEKAKRSTMQ